MDVVPPDGSSETGKALCEIQEVANNGYRILKNIDGK